MPLFNNITEKIGKAAEKTANKAKEIAEITRLNAQISAEEKEIEKYFMEIGKNIFNQSESGQSIDILVIEALCGKIKESERLIREFKNNIEEIKSQKNKGKEI